MHIRLIAILILFVLSTMQLSAQLRLPTDICSDDIVTDAEAHILAEIEAINAVNPLVWIDRSPSCRYVVVVFKADTPEEQARRFVAWDVYNGTPIFDYIRPRYTRSELPVFYWNATETEVVIGTVRERIYYSYLFAFATYPFHIWNVNTSEFHILDQCELGDCLAPLFRQVYWDDTRNWLWTWGFRGAIAFDRSTGAIMNSYPNPPWDGGYAEPYGHRIKFSDDMSHVFVYFKANSAEGLTVWDIDQYRAYSVYVDDFIGSYDTIALSPDNRYLVIGSLAMRVWDLQNLTPIYEERLPIYRHEGPIPIIKSLRFVDNTTVETESDEGMQQWDLHTGELLSDE